MSSFTASPSSKPTEGWTYDVFLSFRGDDTRYGFVDHLYTALVQRGIQAFKDDKTLCQGERISPELLKAIEESKYAVVVFSENYANSHWCLEELARIMECHQYRGQKVLPVFYYVDPSDVRNQKRKFATAFQDHAKFWGKLACIGFPFLSKKKTGEEMENVEKWRKALTSAANLSGFHISKTHKVGESAIIINIVQKIFGDIQPCNMEENLIGIESRIANLYSLLCTEATQEVRMVGIYGMGGIGKTTIAQTLFGRISCKFEGSSFVENVRANSRGRGICTLQEKIIKDIVVAHHEFTILDPKNGAQLIQKRICNKKVLLVLDDVNDMKQLEFLAGKHDWFGRGSRIIITTRNKRLLSHVNGSYEPAVLLERQAVKLFSMHAFKESSPPDEYKELSNHVICKTGYLPLALQVLGSFLHKRDKDEWESILKKLDETPNTKIFDSLKLSFDGLDPDEKKIFLDIACFFRGKDLEHVTRVLSSFNLQKIGIRILNEKSLITVLNKRLDMHDQIQEMGWRVVHESYPNSRLWEPKEVNKCIKKNEELQRIEGIVVQNKQHNVLGFDASVFGSMKNLRLLDVFRKFTSFEPTVLPNELRWFCWNQYPFSSLPITKTCELVGLEMHDGNIEHLWQEQELKNMKFIHLRQLDCLKSFPDVSRAPNIERFVLASCSNLMEVHESLAFLKNLVYVDMSNCWRLKCFPSEIEMESLETLILSRCSSLEHCPEFSERMVKLSKIYLDGCSRIKELPSSIRYLSGLRFLNLTSCTSLKSIPESICDLKHLKSLHLHNCMELQELPKVFGSMEKLEELLLGFTNSDKTVQRVPQSINFHTLKNLSSLTKLRSLRKLDLSWRQTKHTDFPTDLHALSSLEELNLSGNSELTELPESISHLRRLKHLELNECFRLRDLHSLPPGIQILKASCCSSLERIEYLLREYKWLYKIWLVGCWKLQADEENGRYLDTMLQKSFLEKCAAVGHRLSIAVPRREIPSWFDATKNGCDISLKLPPKWYSHIMGFVISGVFTRMWKLGDDYPVIQFTIVNDGEESNLEIEVAYNNDVSLDEIDTVWIGYIPFASFQKVNQDWFDMEGNLAISVKLKTGQLPASCGAHIVYKEDVELVQQVATDYWKLECVSRKGNSFIYEDEFKNT